MSTMELRRLKYIYIYTSLLLSGAQTLINTQPHPTSFLLRLLRLKVSCLLRRFLLLFSSFLIDLRFSPHFLNPTNLNLISSIFFSFFFFVFFLSASNPLLRRILHLLSSFLIDLTFYPLDLRCSQPNRRICKGINFASISS